MPKSHIAFIGALTLVAAQSIKDAIKIRKHLRSHGDTVSFLTEINTTLIDECLNQEHKIEYLMGKLNEHDVPMDEFDHIALNYRPN